MASKIEISDDGRHLVTKFIIDKNASDDENTVMAALSIIMNDDRGFNGLINMAVYLQQPKTIPIPTSNLVN